MTGGQEGELEERRRREFRRTVVGSLVIHVVALGLAVSSPASRVAPPPQAITVELVAAPPRAAAPAPKAAPPKPRVIRPKQVVLPEKPSEPKPRAKPEPEKPKPKPKPEPQRPAREEVVLDPEPKVEQSLDDLLSDMRQERGEAPPQPAQTAAVPSPASGAGRRVSPEVLDWVRRTKIHVSRAWVVPPGFRTEALETHVVVKLDAGGNVVGAPSIKQRSGNPWYDEGVIRGMEKASPLPAPPSPGEWDFIFTPEDSY